MMRSPTSEECVSKTEIDCGTLGMGYATYHPQMGGYCGKCIVVPHNGCFTVYLWHDGDFPYDDGEPVITHYCDPNDFIRFGEFIASLPGMSSE